MKQALTKTLVLISPDFSKYFYFFSFASIVVVLLQKNPQGQEEPIAFFSKALRDAPLMYNIMEKQAFDLVKALKRLQSIHPSLTHHCICPKFSC